MINKQIKKLEEEVNNYYWLFTRSNSAKRSGSYLKLMVEKQKELKLLKEEKRNEIYGK